MILLPRAEGNVLNLAVLFILGVMSAEYLPLVDLKIFAYAVLSLTVVRMVPVTISLIGSHLNIRPAFSWAGLVPGVLPPLSLCL